MAPNAPVGGDNSSKRRPSHENEDLYAILEIEKNATPADIKRAYRRLALRYHPDKNPDDPKSAEKFKEINRAHAVLSDPNKRQIYDQYGSFGLYLAEQLDEDIMRAFFALRNPCLKCCVGTLFFLSCCCCCLCCCCCCDFCCGRCRPAGESEDFSGLIDEQNPNQVPDAANTNTSSPVTDQPRLYPSTPVIPTNETSQLVDETKE